MIVLSQTTVCVYTPLCRISKQDDQENGSLNLDNYKMVGRVCCVLLKKKTITNLTSYGVAANTTTTLDLEQALEKLFNSCKQFNF